MIDVVSVHRFLSRLGGRTQATLCVCMITITKRPLNYPFSRIPVNHLSRLPYIIINSLLIYWIQHVEPAIWKRLLKLSVHDRVLKFAPIPKSISSPCRIHSTNMSTATCVFQRRKQHVWLNENVLLFQIKSVIKRLWEVVMLNCAPIIVTIYSSATNVRKNWRMVIFYIIVQDATLCSTRSSTTTSPTFCVP